MCETIGTVISLALLTAAATAAAAAATTGLELVTSEPGSKSWNISCHQGKQNSQLPNSTYFLESKFSIIKLSVKKKKKFNKQIHTFFYHTFSIIKFSIKKKKKKKKIQHETLYNVKVTTPTFSILALVF